MGGGELGALPERAGRAFEGADVQFLQVLADPVPDAAAVEKESEAIKARYTKIFRI